MKLSVSPAKISGTIEIPSSKSHTIRAIVLATMAQGASIIKSPLISQDTLSCMNAAMALGAWIKRGDDSIWKISGTGGNILEPAHTLDMGNSGTGTNLLAAMASLANHPVAFDGDDSLRSRQFGPLLNALSNLGVSVKSNNGKCPICVTGPIHGGKTTVDGKISQYLSALLCVAPILKEDTEISVDNLNEVPYVEMTLDWLTNRMHVSIEQKTDPENPFRRIFMIKGGQSYKAFSTKIRGDFSSACFPLVAAAITGGKVRLKNLCFDDTQGDKAIFDYVKKMGASVDVKDDEVIVKGDKLKAVELDLNSTPDALPVMAVAAACARGRSVFRNIAQARNKETDRIACMAQELTKMGIEVEEFDDGLAVNGGRLQASTHLCSYKDHRIAMALAVAALAVNRENAISTIDDADCISVTYPSFIQDFEKLNARFYTI